MEDYILIAEDDNDINQMLSELLTLNGYRNIQAFSGTEAMLHVKNCPPAAVILDLMLPGMTGEEVLSPKIPNQLYICQPIASPKSSTISFWNAVIVV